VGMGRRRACDGVQLLNDCCAPAYGKVFGERGARRAAERYRKKGLDEDARWIVDVLREYGLQGASVLELGGGLGALHLELARNGAASAVNVELSPEWEHEASLLLREHELEGRVERRVGDAVQEAEELEAADIVVMHRVVCCYPDPDRLMDIAAERAGRVLAVSFPRDRLVARLVVAAANLWLRLRRISFRSYVHPERTIEAAAVRHGLRSRSDRRSMIWRVSVFDRGSAEH
jgi:SAM-dependent methyltransferase